MKTLLAFVPTNILFSQYLMLVLFVALVGLAIYQLVGFLRNNNDKSMYY